jgi:hypothetical protein
MVTVTLPLLCFQQWCSAAVTATTTPKFCRRIYIFGSLLSLIHILDLQFFSNSFDKIIPKDLQIGWNNSQMFSQKTVAIFPTTIFISATPTIDELFLFDNQRNKEEGVRTTASVQ